MSDDRPFSERVQEALIRAAVRARQRLAALLKPGAFVIFAAATLASIGALMKGLDFPNNDLWEGRSLAVWALVVCGAVTYLGYVFVTLGFAHLLRGRDQEAQLYRACRDIASQVERHTGLDRDAIAVHVWIVRGLWGVKRLERRATFVPGDRPPTAIVWRKGKGALGRCWEKDEFVRADLEELQLLAPTEQAFSSLRREERFDFTWQEFQTTQHYKAVLVWPLHGGPEAAPDVVGCLSIDVQAPGAAAQLDRFLLTRRNVFMAHVALCESVLRHQ